MSYNENLTHMIRKALKEKGVHFIEKRMFRGISFMVNNKICLSAGDDEMLCRIDPSLHEKLITKKGCRTMVMKGREYKGYVLVKEDVLQTKNDLDYWIKLALDFNKIITTNSK